MSDLAEIGHLPEEKIKKTGTFTVNALWWLFLNIRIHRISEGTTIYNTGEGKKAGALC